MKVAIIGSGYVGLVTGTCLANMGNDVTNIDSDAKKIAQLKKKHVPIFEPGLEELIVRNMDEGRLSFSSDLDRGIAEADVVFICVQTPPRKNGSADLTFIEKVAKRIARNLTGYKLIVEKSTVPVQTGHWVLDTIKKALKKHVPFDVASNPEFLRQGSAVKDFLEPDRIVVGVESEKAKLIMEKLYRPFQRPIFFTDIKSAELIKHAANSFLALKISYANALANICERSGANVDHVIRGMGLDPRIGTQFFGVGIGYGGSCFPKDVSSFSWIARQLGYDFGLLREVERINKNQRVLFCRKIKKVLKKIPGKSIALWGLSFKPNTDDLRNAPSIDVVKFLIKEKAHLRAYDPVAMTKMRALFPYISYTRTPYDAAKGADAVLILTEWQEFKGLDLGRLKTLMRCPVIIDARNIYNPSLMEQHGFTYISMGRTTDKEIAHKFQVKLRRL